MAVKERTLLSKICMFIAWLILCILFGVVIEWFVMTRYFADQGAYHSLNLLKVELSYLEQTGLILTNYGNRLINTLLIIQTEVYQTITQTFYLEKSLSFLSNNSVAAVGFAKLGLLPPQEYAVSTLNMINVMTLRMVVIVLSLPIFVLFFFYGIGEGLTRRGIRKYQVKNESSFIFHHAKRVKNLSLFIPVTLYMAWPNALSPVTVFMPCAFLYGVTWVVMASKFKKNF